MKIIFTNTLTPDDNVKRQFLIMTLMRIFNESDFSLYDHTFYDYLLAKHNIHVLFSDNTTIKSIEVDDQTYTMLLLKYT